MMRRAVLLLAALLVGAAFVAAPAGAQAGHGADDNYAALCSPLTVTGTPSPGTTVTVSGTAATAGASIAIVILPDTVVGTTTSGPDRTFTKDVLIPANLDPSITTIQLQAFQIGDNTDPITGCPAQVAALDIVRPATPLARTGSNSTLPLARLGFGLLAAGGVAMIVSRRRKASVATAA
jgi:hypothetical protein